MAPQTLHFGLLLLPEHQWLDAAGSVDYLNSHSRPYIKALGQDEAIVAKALDMEWHYISHDLKPVQASSGPAGIPTCTYADCPELDYLVVPGNDPAAPLPEGCAEFLQKLIVHDRFKALLTVCTGSMAIAQAGILDGYSVCSNKWALKAFASAGILNKKVKWIGNKRWNVDRKVWSAGGVTAGIDLAAEFSRVHFDPAIVELVRDLTEYESNPAQPDPFSRMLDGVNLS